MFYLSQDMLAAYTGVRASAWGQLQAACSALQPASADLPHTALFLLDQAAAAGLLTPPAAESPGTAVQPAWLAAAMKVASECPHASASACTAAAPGLGPAPGLNTASSAGVDGLVTPLEDSAVAAHFEIGVDALQSAAVTLRTACATACATPVTVHMVLDLFGQVLSAGRLDYQVGPHVLFARWCRSHCVVLL